jgi:hypothetical protein
MARFIWVCLDPTGGLRRDFGRGDPLGATRMNWSLATMFHGREHVAQPGCALHRLPARVGGIPALWVREGSWSVPAPAPPPGRPGASARGAARRAGHLRGGRRPHRSTSTGSSRTKERDAVSVSTRREGGRRGAPYGPPSQWSIRWWSGLNPWPTPQMTAWVRLCTWIFR